MICFYINLFLKIKFFCIFFISDFLKILKIQIQIRWFLLNQ
jgi:hypothetical protein